MKKLPSLFVVFCMSALVVSFSIAADDQHVTTRDGIKVTVQYYPLGPND